ncbi:MAG: hypothetical protein IJ206_03340 [Oscillospiraceae bacterium]|nr:hypothetical protein [Oscillospiraceae bacterium]
MIAKKLEFQMHFGLSLPGFAMTPGSIEYYPGCKPEGPSGPPQDAPDGLPAGGPERGDGPAPVMPAQEYVLTMEEKDGVIKGVLKSEHGCQKIDDIVESEFAISFTAYAGSEGVEIFRFVLMLSDSTAQIVGYAAGVKPFFRSFMPLSGRIAE